MRFLRDKRGIELSMNVIIIAIILVVVLVIVILFFTGGITNAINKIKGVLGTQLIDYNTAQLKCQSWCQSYVSNPNTNIKKDFCTSTFNIDTNGDNKPDYVDATCNIIGISCDAIQCSAG